MIRYKTKIAAYREDVAEYGYHGECNWEAVKDGNRSLEDFVATLTDEQLMYLCIGDYKDSRKDTDEVMDVIGDASGTVAGAAGETTNRLSKLGIKSVVMADGPAGLRLSVSYRLEGDVAKEVDSGVKKNK